jgi:hypothetical protein
MQDHRTATCTNKVRPCCIPCGTDGRPGWGTNCLIFQCKCNELNKHTEDNQMPYCPTTETWTQAKEPSQSSYTSQPPRPPTQDRRDDLGRHRQSTLNFQNRAPDPQDVPMLSQQNQDRHGTTRPRKAPPPTAKRK